MKKYNNRKRTGSVLGLSLIALMLCLSLVMLSFMGSMHQYEKKINQYKQKQLNYLTRSLALSVETAFVEAEYQEHGIRSIIEEQLSEHENFSDQVTISGLEDYVDQVILSYDYSLDNAVLTISIAARQGIWEAEIVICLEQSDESGLSEWVFLSYGNRSFDDYRR